MQKQRMSGQNQKTDKRMPGTISLYGWTVVIFMVQMATVTGRGLWL